MRRLIFLFMLLGLTKLLPAQHVYTIKADSVKITGCDSAELIIENHTQAVKGFLFNKGNGRTEFRSGLIKLNDSSFLIGNDTLKASFLIKAITVGGYFVGRDSVFTITSGSSSTVGSGYNVILFNPSTVMSNYSLTMPSAIHTSNYLTIISGGAITSGAVVSSFSLIANSGQSFDQVSAPVRVLYGQPIIYKYYNNVWYRIQ